MSDEPQPAESADEPIPDNDDLVDAVGLCVDPDDPANT